MSDLFRCLARLCALMFALALSMRVPLYAHAPVSADQDNAVGLVVQFANGVSLTRCVRFAETQLTGYEVLVLAALPLEVNFSGPGAAICRINDEGCPSDDCFCQCRSLSGDCRFWNYWHRQGDVWMHSDIGASSHVVRIGDIEGWSFGAYSATLGAPLPALSFAEICAVSTASAPVTVAPTANSTIRLGGDNLPASVAASTPVPTPAPVVPVPPPTSVSAISAPAGATVTPTSDGGELSATADVPRTPTVASLADAPSGQTTPAVLTVTPTLATAPATEAISLAPTRVALTPMSTMAPAVVAVAEQRVVATVVLPASPRRATATIAQPNRESESPAQGILPDYMMFGAVVIVLVGLLLMTRRRKMST